MTLKLHHTYQITRLSARHSPPVIVGKVIEIINGRTAVISTDSGVVVVEVGRIKMFREIEDEH